MYPAFRSRKSARAFCLLLMVPLLLPFVLFWAGLPPREEAYESIAVRNGQPGREIQAIYRDPQSPDILFLGSSLELMGIVPSQLERTLSSDLGRPVHIAILGMSWQGLDLQYFILRDYLQAHHPGLIVLNPPTLEKARRAPHPQAFHWFRYGDFDGDFVGLSPLVRLEVYSHMVLGGPRELLSRLRPNRLGADETSPEAYWDYMKVRRNSGYHGAPLIPENDPPRQEQQAMLLPLDSNIISAKTEPPPYSSHFFKAILDLAAQRHCPLVLLHIPEDSEYGQSAIPEYDWSRSGADGYQMIGVPTQSLYAGMSQQRFQHFYADNHMNQNGGRWFTSSIAPAILQALKETHSHAQALSSNTF